MPRRARVAKRVLLPDSKYGSKQISKFINNLMIGGKKSIAEGIMYGALTRAESTAARPAVDVFEAAMRNATPSLEVKPRRVGGSTYQVPGEIKGDRRTALAMRWLIRSARSRTGKSMVEKLAAEFVDASRGVGATVKRREDTHKMAEANKAYAHYRW
jgi:small subunit ribosomal protein S7